MAKNKVSEYSSTASNNTDIGNINIAEGCAPSGINNAIRELMAQLKDMQSGTDGDGFTVGGAFTCSGAAVFSSTVSLGATATATTQSAGDNSTKVATTAFITAALSALYPVGTIYTNASVSTNPATLFGFGTWTAFGAGRVLVGLNGSDSSFDTLEETGGSKDAVVVSHTHTATDSGHTHTTFNGSNLNSNVTNGGVAGTVTRGSSASNETNSASASISVSTTGSSGTNANLQPYIVVYMWKRTA